VPVHDPDFNAVFDAAAVVLAPLAADVVVLADVLAVELVVVDTLVVIEDGEVVAVWASAAHPPRMPASASADTKAAARLLTLRAGPGAGSTDRGDPQWSGWG